MISQRCGASILAILMVLALGADLGRAEIHTGTAGIGGYYEFWDFSDSAMVEQELGDLGSLQTLAVLAWSEPMDVFLVTCPPAAVAFAPQGSVYDALTEAPDDSLLQYEYSQPAIPWWTGTCYILKTQEGHYVKFRVVTTVQYIIEYVYQDDGSRRFYNLPVPIQPSTWGRIKSLYSE